MIQIKKAKLNSVGYLEIEYSETIKEGKDSYSVDVTKNCKYDPHQDLKIAFDGLRLFLVELCEQVKDLPDSDEEVERLLSDFKVTGFVIGGSDEHEGVTLIGRKKLANNRVLNLVSPFTKWEDEHNGYSSAWALQQQVEKCQEEVLEYLGGKKAPRVQSEIEFPEPEEEQVEA